MTRPPKQPFARTFNLSLFEFGRTELNVDCWTLLVQRRSNGCH